MPWGLGSWIHRQKPSSPQEALLLSRISQRCCTDGILSSHCRSACSQQRQSPMAAAPLAQGPALTVTHRADGGDFDEEATPPPVGTWMAAPVPWACCAVLAAAAAAAVVYAQRHSPQETPHVQYERLGSDVTLPCGTANWDAAVTWRVNGTDLAPDLLNGSQLVLRGLELGHSGVYACFHRDSWHLRHQVLLNVGWGGVGGHRREVSVSLEPWTDMPCLGQITEAASFQEPEPAVLMPYRMPEGGTAGLSAHGSKKSVKPDPPENVVARPVPSNPRRLEVTWQTPSTWPDPESFPLKFFLRYRPLILDQWQHERICRCGSAW
ncbi:Ciliary neurotrophic factor receptor subunit alpha, partial [Eschrichtius robustus]|nr:Ciliary neurotrophic factor receptor subunit alpha [Eschrichtius robustus]